MTPKELNRLKAAELRQLAADLHIAQGKTLRKPALVAAIVRAMADAESSPGVAPPPTAAPAGSSTVATTATPAQPRAKTTETGLPVPDHYGQDRLVLMVQDPSHLFAYWELAEGTRQQLVARQKANGETPVLLIHAEAGMEQREIDITGGNYYFSVPANASYRADLALRNAEGQLTVIVSSNQVSTPPSGPSDRVDEQWMAVDPAFSELLVRAGLPAAAGSSAEAIGKEKLRSRLWSETGVAPVSSAGAEAVGGAGSVGASQTLASQSLGSQTLAKFRP